MKQLMIALCIVLFSCVAVNHGASRSVMNTARNTWKISGTSGRGSCFPIKCQRVSTALYEVWFITADHVIDGQPEGWMLERGDEQICNGMVLERDMPLDIAVVKAMSVKPVQCVPMRLDDEPADGEEVYLAGYGGPDGVLWIEQGLACGKGRASVPVVMGDSGGPMIDAQGRVFGVCAAIEVVENYRPFPIFVWHHDMYHPLCDAKKWLLDLAQRGLLKQ